MRTHRPAETPDGVVHLRAGGTSVVLARTGTALPRVLHWGADLGELDDDALGGLARVSEPPLVSGQPDVVVPLALLPEHSSGWMGTPGLTGHRGGTDFSTAFAVTSFDVDDADDPLVAARVRVTAADAVAGLGLEIVLELLASGLLRMRAALTNEADGVFDVGTLDLALPVPPTAREVLDLTGRHLRERALQRHEFTLGTHLRESRRARGHDASLVLAAGSRGFGWRHGEVHALHVAWSGNTRCYAERTNLGDAMLAAGELLLAGEVRLQPGEAYTGPWVYASHGSGLDDMAGRFHRFLRVRPTHPRSPRPVTLNVWEAVYFGHDLDRLTELADRAAAVGVERYVLDDGWFGSRRDDTSGLGDWYVSPDVWPSGLGPIIDHVHGLGMQFGLWFEPEMVNPDSDLYRAHPDWILSAGGRLPVAARSQQVLDLGNPDAYAYIRERLLAVLDEYAIDYVKWDYNRDLVEPGQQATGRAGVHEQTLAVYRLLDEVRAAHPGLEIESCAGGGGRVDLGILERTDRVWASDCIDPLERQLIEAGTRLLLPPELIGSHIASPVSHTTGRAHTLDFRAGTAFFSHLGIEWDLTAAEPADLDRLAGWVTAHKLHRDLLHSGTVVHTDDRDESLWVHGVVAEDRREAVFTLVQLRTPVASPVGRVRLPGLDPDTTYRVAPLPPGDTVGDRAGHAPPPWWSRPAHLTGRVLGAVGVQAPVLNPEQLVLLHLVAR
ncbi:alpha-galactosidase [Georgenia sp. H159]|uniref:alpha-galactosidase n=1 Tax=Georgenia sp. H159 TaxID=3076115 RepID=UPI002D777AB1|nr:alpha-galactosidase [Georgenia sp. H159]